MVKWPKENMVFTLLRRFILILIVASFFCMPVLRLVRAEIIDPNAVTIQKPGVVKFDWTSGNLDYKGVNADSGAADGDTDWVIYKYTWVSGNPTVILKRTGSWTGRTTYF